MSIVNQPQNPNWPLMDIAVAFNAGPKSAMPAPHWVSVKTRTMGQLSTNRGRQYELDQVQTGTWTGQLDNKDAALDPSNGSSPFSPQVVPYRMFRHRAQYPATINILTADQATAGKASNLAVLPPWVSIVASGAMTLSFAAFSGSTNRYVLSYGASNPAGGGVKFTGFSVVAGQSHAVSCVVSASANNSLRVQLSIQWINSVGGVISTSTGTSVLTSTINQTASVVGTAPANACGAVVNLLSSNSVAPATVIFASQVQAEYNTSIHTYVTPGTWYSIFTGYMERWPQSWTMNGQFGQSNPTAVDAFGYLSQSKLLSAAYQEVLISGPTFFYPLDEPAPDQPSIPELFYDLTGNRRPATVEPGAGAPVGNITPGTALSATGGYLPQGIGGPVVALGPANGGQHSFQQIDLRAAGTNPGGNATANWTRVVAFQTPKNLAYANQEAILLEFAIAGGAILRVMGFYDAAGNFGSGAGHGLQVVYQQTGVTLYFVVNPTADNNMSDGGWHFLTYGGTAGGGFTGQFDGIDLVLSFTLSTPITASPYTTDFVGGDTFGVINGPSGNVAFVAEFPYSMSSAQSQALYSAFRYGGSGLGVASSGTRYSDILRWASWAGAQALDNGGTIAYGPATELAATSGSSGTDVVSALQTVVDTEGGFHYVSADGTITFKSRQARYNQTTPVVIFGEQSGEVPYTNINTGFDPTRIANDVSVAQTQTSATQRDIDAASVSVYGDIPLQRTVNTLNPLEQSDAAQYLLLRNSQPVQRIEGISVDVGSNPALWTSLLPLELGTRVRVMRRPPLGAATIQVDGFVEQMNWTFDDRGNATVDFQISVNNRQQFWQLDSATFSVLNTTTILGY